MWRQICIVLLFLIFGAISTNEGVRGESPEKVRVALDVAQDWLGDDDSSLGWNEFLKTETLQQELDKGEQADPKVVDEILSLYSSDSPGLERRRFAAVRAALAQWKTTLSLPSIDELTDRIREAKSEFVPSEEGSVDRAQNELSKLLSGLDRFLASGGERKESGWKDYLRWDELKSELESDGGPDLKKLERIQNRYLDEFEGLELPAFVAARRALREYAEAVVYSGDKFQDQFEKTVDTLANGIESYAEQPSHEKSAMVALLLGTLERSGQLPDLVSAVRHHYSKPNYYLQISASLVGVGFEETIDEETPVRENRGSARVTGRVDTTGEIVSRLVPNASEGEIQLQLLGNANSSTRTVSGPATIVGSSVTTIDVRKTLFATDDGINGTAAVADCETDTSISDVLGGAAVESRARPQAEARLPRSEYRTARATERRMSGELEDAVGEAVDDANDRFRRQFKAPLMRRDEDPGEMKFSTSEEFLFGEMAQANAFQIAAFNRPPALQTGLDMGVQMHESYINNYVEAVHGGTVLTDEEAAQIAEGMMERVPERFQRGEDAEPWSITFRRRKPITVVFGDGGYSVTIRGRRYTSGDRSLGPWHVTANYQFEMLPTGPRRIRQGDLEIKPADFSQRSNQKLSVAEVAEKKILDRRFSELFTPIIEPEGIELPGRWKKAGKLVMKQLTADGGWLVMGWEQPEQVDQEITQTAEVNR